MDASNFAEDLWMDILFGDNSVGASTYFVGLIDVTPFTDVTAVSEPVGNGYARQSITNDKTGTGWSGSTGGVVTNAGLITFPTATGPGWGNVYFAALFDAVSAGNLFCWGALVGAPVAVGGGTQLSINIGDLSFTLD